IPAIVGPIAFVTSPATYQTSVGIWVDRPTYLRYEDDLGRMTPVQDQSRRIGETVRTRAFLIEVAKKTPLAPLVGSETDEQELARATDALRRYMAGNPRLADPNRGGVASGSRPDLSAAPMDPQLADLQRRVELQQQDVERARSALDRAQLNISAGQEGQDLQFQVVDPPRMPTQRTREIRKMLMFPIA